MKRRKLISLLAAGLLVIILLLWMSGKFTAKVPDTALKSANQDMTGIIVPVRLVKMPLTESAVGAVQAVRETTIASKLLSRITEMNVKAGQSVKKNDILMRLDETDLKARLQQTKSSVTMAEAANNQAISDERRLGILIKSNAISQQEYDKSVTKLKSSNAELKKAQEAVNEIQSILDYATVLSPMDGTVVDKKVDVGDTVVPGQVLIKLFDPTRMQLVASVRESLAYKLKVGQDIRVKIETMNFICSGTVSEIVPESSATSRTFQVKVTGPCPPGIYSGMFGRIYIPLADEQVLVVPVKAIRRFGQLEMVDVSDSGRLVRRAVRTGRSFGDDIEILSGLQEGEQVSVPSGPEQTPEVNR